MNLNLNVPKCEPNLTPRITVIGVGGAGGNAVNNMIQAKLEGVDFLIANTDAQAIQLSLCDRCIQLGRNITQGLGAGARPDIGRAATEEALDEILGELEGINMVFITAGMGGGTGTGGAPVIARAAREAGILTVGVVTKPFHFEGVHRMRMAEAGISELTQHVDTLIVIPNQNLFRVANEKTTFADAFKMADDVLHSGVRGVTDLMVMPGLINLDFADIRSIMTEMGKAMMGTGEAEGEQRAIAAAEAAISNPLLDETSMKGARGVLINITGGPDMTLFEVDETANRIRDEVDPDANIIFGSTFDSSLEGRMRVSVVATGIEADVASAPKPVSLSLISGSGDPRTSSGKRSASPAPAARAQAAPAQAVQTAQAVQAQAVAAEPVHIEAPQSAPTAQALGATAAALAQPAPQTFAAVQTVEEPAPVAQAAPERRAPMPQEATRRAPTPQDAGRRTAPPEDAGRRGGSSLFAYSRATARAEAQPAHAPAAAAPAQAPAGDSFIAPPPVEPERTPEAVRRSEQADPFAAAALANGARASKPAAAAPGFDRKKAQSLFAKVTGGAARALQAAAQGDEQRAAQRAAEVPSPAAPPVARTAAQPAAPAAQQRLSGLDPAERVNQSQAEEDTLDIPAFLRRQAN